MTWNLRDGAEILCDWSEDWQVLNRCCNRSNPVLDIKFVGRLYEEFGKEEPVYLAIETKGKVVQSMMLLQYGSVGRWKLFMPSQAAVGPVIMRERRAGELVASLKELCTVLPNHAWELGFQRQDPDFSALTTIETDAQVFTVGHSLTTFVNVSGRFEDYWNSRSKSLRKLIRRKQRLLEQDAICCKLNVVNQEHEIHEAVDRHADLESRGWKGREGTAIGRRNVQGTFYRKVMHDFAVKGTACAYQLIFDNTIVASLLTITQNRLRVVLKTTYDERYKKYAPGRLLDYLMLQESFSDSGVSVIENYTRASDEDIKWASGSRNIYHINYYRNSLYRNAYKLYKHIAHLENRLINNCVA